MEREKLKQPRKWIYRGEGFRTQRCGSRDPDLTLKTSLDLVLDRFDRREVAEEVEWWLIHEFQRRLHHYLAAPPHLDDLAGWLALMRHYAAPVRLLDWTHSHNIAAFMALVNATSDKECYVWALDMNWCKERANKRMGRSWLRDKSYIPQDGLPASWRKFREYFPIRRKPRRRLRKAVPFVYPVNSHQLSERQTIQQGTFLCAGDVASSFQKNLEAMAPLEGSLRLWSIAPDLRRTMLKELQEMGISEASLYPGLDGFARSLKLHWFLLDPEKASY